MKKTILLFILIFLSVQCSYSQQFEWVRNYPMEGKSAAIDSSGNIYVIGDDWNYHLHIIKYHSSGAIIWSKDMSISSWGGYVYSASDKSGNLYFCLENSDHYFQLVKYDSSGNFKWTKIFSNEGYSAMHTTVNLQGY
jgi:hypothetical protein